VKEYEDLTLLNPNSKYFYKTSLLFAFTALKFSGNDLCQQQWINRRYWTPKVDQTRASHPGGAAEAGVAQWAEDSAVKFTGGHRFNRATLTPV
jgi:hypothetical protein